ncbi:MAG: hypothetical protein PHN35_01425 [Clostridia bacterium]|nr:hypothetical protein [Clostridia bacterium]MDD4798106.1 hypothetical protein [Clostridia bacterium]
MLVTAKVDYPLNDFTATKEHNHQVTLAEGASVRSLIINLKIPVGEVGMVVINGNFSNTSSLLKDGDIIQLYPMLEGG